jgi:hypothetical protein
VKLTDASLEDIKAYAHKLGYRFSDADAQDVKDTAPNWWPAENLTEAVDDYITAFFG